MCESSASLHRTALAISTFRADEEILDRLRELFSTGDPQLGAVIIVDSLGSGRIPEAIATNRWPVRYENASVNLGSAGNLAERLRLAAELDFEWCLAVNHDGTIDLEAAKRLLWHSEQSKDVGAVYPTLRMTSADGQRDRPRRRFSTFGFLNGRRLDLNPEKVTEVAWSSSNGALYRVQAAHRAIWSELWMGYEDLALGWELQRKGWRQILAHDVEVPDNYEFKKVRIFGRSIYLADKPSWYSYYQARNIWLIARRTGGEAISRTSAVVRILIDVALIIGFRSDKARRLMLLFRGLYDGLAGVSGRGPVP